MILRSHLIVMSHRNDILGFILEKNMSLIKELADLPSVYVMKHECEKIN